MSKSPKNKNSDKAPKTGKTMSARFSDISAKVSEFTGTVKRKFFFWNMQSSMLLMFSIIMLTSSTVTGVICVTIFALADLPDNFVGWFLFFALIFAAGLGIFLAIIFSRLWLGAAKNLARAADEVARGNFSVRIPEKRHHGEFRAMLRAFNHMTEHLAHTEMFRNDFINYFSHEFKTPIVSMRGFARQLEDPNLTEEQKSEYVRIIIDECNRLTGLSSNILLLAQFENQKIITSPTTFSVDEQIRRVLVVLEKEWSKKNIELDLDKMEEVHITTNEEMLSLVWTNLITNAIKYNNDGGKIEIICRDEGDRLHVVIADNGIGMSEETKTHVFEKFFQGDTSHKTVGNGLGLALVMRIVELCHGTIEVDSTEGEGSTFAVTLPKICV